MMQTKEINAVYADGQDERYLPMDPNMMSPQQVAYDMQGEQESPYFSQPNDLRVIQEYNREENLPNDMKASFWALASKSIKLGFWNDGDEREIFLHKNIIKVGHIMAKPRHKYTFEERHKMNQIDMLVYADFKRGVGMERYKINERTLQATSVTQNIMGGASGPVGKRGGVMAGLKSFFG